MFQEAFETALRQSGAQPEKVKALWLTVHAQYSAGARWYHNLSHLDHIFQELLPVKHAISNWNTVMIATAFHDLVYDPLRADNEEESAIWAETKLSGLIDATSLAICLYMIRATKTHAADRDPDVQVFVDADLSILGAFGAVYRNYSLQIRKEYNIFPDTEYKPRRQKVLQQFLQREQIFGTRHFRDRYEAQARENLKAELALLKSEADSGNRKSS